MLRVYGGLGSLETDGEAKDLETPILLSLDSALQATGAKNFMMSSHCWEADEWESEIEYPSSFCGLVTRLGHVLVDTGAQSGVIGLATWRRWVSALGTHFGNLGFLLGSLLDPIWVTF